MGAWHLCKLQNDHSLWKAVSVDSMFTNILGCLVTGEVLNNVVIARSDLFAVAVKKGARI